MPIDDENSGRLSRWSKRKIAVAKERELEESAASTEVVDEEAQAQRAAELAQNSETAEAFDLETLNKETDFSIFMKDGVPALLKRQAMAALWRSSPVFAVVDGLVDYDDDFGSPDLNMKTFKSAYQIGKGYLDKVDSDAEAKAKAAAKVTHEKQQEDSTDEVQTAEQDDQLEREEVDDDLNESDDVATVEDADANPDSELKVAETALAEEEEISEQPIPKVSLRKRLQLEPYG